MHHVPGSQEKYYEIEQGCADGKLSVHRAPDKLESKHHRIDNSQPFHSDRNDKHKQYLGIRECRRESQENRHIDIISAEHHRYDGKILVRRVDGQCRPQHGNFRFKEITVPHQQKASRNGKEHPLEQIDVIPVGAPGAL